MEKTLPELEENVTEVSADGVFANKVDAFVQYSIPISFNLRRNAFGAHLMWTWPTSVLETWKLR